MKKGFKLLLVLLTVGMASCTSYDNPADYGSQYSETSEQKAFWATFDAWKTDSCTVGDDFFMHMIGMWWKNPTGIFPNGLMPYAGLVNDSRVNEIYNTNADLRHLYDNLKNAPVMGLLEADSLLTAKFDELWAGATTREEALAAVGRAWAEGYSLDYELFVEMHDSVSIWMIDEKIPPYITSYELYSSKEEMWRSRAPHQGVRLTRRAAQGEWADLQVILDGMNLDIKDKRIVIANEAIEGLQYLLNETCSTVDGIKEYLWTTVLLLDGPLVNDDLAEQYDHFVEEYRKLKGKTKNFTLTRQSIKSYVYNYMSGFYALNDYINKYITPAIRQQYVDYCEEFRQAMRQRLERNQWLGDATRKNALEKLDNMEFYVGGTPIIPDCVIPTLTGKDCIEDIRQLRKARMDGYLWAATQSRKNCMIFLEDLLFLRDLTMDYASYYPIFNAVKISPSNLLDPYVMDVYEYPLQLAFIASTIGHEITHAFDTNGSQYDKWGNYVNWWTDSDAEKFQSRCNQLVENYNRLQLMPWEDPTVYADGKNTLTENTADLGGCLLGLDILLDRYRNASEAEKKAVMQRYFQAWAIQWSTTYGLEYANYIKANDVHSLQRERTNGVVQNINEWYDAFDVTSGTLFLPSSERAVIW